MTENILNQLLENDEYKQIKKGDLIEGKVISIQGTSVFVNLSPYGTGIIYGKEYIIANDIVKKLNVGDEVIGKIIESENEDGYIELSLREAKQALIWEEVEKAIKDKTILDIVVKEANKGGLIIEWKGITGFLPASQLSSENYPKIEDKNKEKIIKKLRKLIGQKLSVRIIFSDSKEGKLIFTENGAGGIGIKEERIIPSKYSIGDILDCEITGIVDFGVFIKIEDGLEGLVHISELDWSLVENPRTMFKVEQKVQAKIIEIKDGKISFSIKALSKDPWEEAKDKYKKEDKVRGVVIKYNKYGSLVSIEQGVAGLVYVSDFENETDMKNSIELGKSYDFEITLFKPKDHKMTMRLLIEE